MCPNSLEMKLKKCFPIKPSTKKSGKKYESTTYNCQHNIEHALLVQTKPNKKYMGRLIYTPNNEVNQETKELTSSNRHFTVLQVEACSTRLRHCFL
jgi:adenine-specific DNA glycosylase